MEISERTKRQIGQLTRYAYEQANWFVVKEEESETALPPWGEVSEHTMIVNTIYRCIFSVVCTQQGLYRQLVLSKVGNEPLDSLEVVALAHNFKFTPGLGSNWSTHYYEKEQLLVVAQAIPRI